MAENTGQGADGRGAADRRLQFGEFVLDVGRQQLLRGEREIPLTPKSFKLLTLLALHPGQVLTKERLLDEVWADVHVLEGVVKVCIADIRKALGETAARPRHLQTVQRRGYRFEGPVREEAASPRPPQPAEALSPQPAEAAGPKEGAPSAPPRAAKVALSPSGLRRQVTVVFCELEGLAGFEAALAAEDAAACLEVWEQAFSAVVRSLGGSLVSGRRGSLIACFGHPTSFEDDAGRALRAALRLLERVPALNARCERLLGAVPKKPLQLRVGLATDAIDIGDGAESGSPELGPALDRAQEHAGSAEPGSVALGSSTRRLVGHAFRLEPIATGSGSEPLFRALGAPSDASHLDVADARKLTPIAGREHELSLILDRWEVAREGQGQGLLVSGEAGIGKSRLLHALHDRLREEEHGWLELRASAFHRNSSFHPVVELLRHSFLLTADDAPEEQVARIEAGLATTDLPVDEALPLIANLMALPLPGDLPPLQLSPERQRQRTLELMCAWILSLTDRRPHVLIAEDLHWADPSTVEFLGALIEQSQSVPLLLVLTHRPEFEPPWASRPNLAVLPLTALTRKQVDAMIDALADGRRVPRSVRDYVVAKADGVPLFVEELTNNLLESELLEESDGGYERTDPLPALAVPTTLQDSLEARLDRLGPSKDLCLLASAIGRELPHGLLEEVAGVGQADLEALLQPLLDAGLLYRRGAAPNAIYTFKHALIQETAYRSLLPETRESFHARIARAFEQRFPERVEAEPESIARHLREAGQVLPAIEALERAGLRASAAGAYVEAIAHLGQALELMPRLPEGPARGKREAVLQVALAVPLVAVRGYGAPEVEEAYARARELSEQLGETHQQAEAVDGLVTFYVTQSRLDDATELAAQQLALAERVGDPAPLLGGHYANALIRYFRGDPVGALAHYDLFDAIFDPAQHTELMSVRGENLAVAASLWRGWTLWLRGYPDRAIEVARAGVEVAEKAGHVYSQGYALAWQAVVHMNRKERPLAIEAAEASVAISEEQGFAIPLGVARLARLRCLGDEIGNDERIALGEAVIAELAATGTKVAIPQIMGGTAEFCLECGRPEMALNYLNAGFALSVGTGQPHWDAEMHRIRGELLLVQQADATDEAEAALRQAVQVAREQQAKMLELRAASRLAGLLRGTDRFDAAKAELADVYGWFTEGFETADLIGAAELLEA